MRGDDGLLKAAGDLAVTYAAVDWSDSPVGAPGTWSPTLRAVFTTVCRTEFPATLLWGPEAVVLYNAAYLPILGDKHPGALGRPAREVFPEAWDYISALVEEVRTTGRAVYLRDTLVPLSRGEDLREAFFTFCYSAVSAPDGVVEGVLDIVSETTREVLSARRLALLDRLREALADRDEPTEVREATVKIVRAAGADSTDARFTRVETATPAVPAEHLRQPGTTTRLQVQRHDDGTRTARVVVRRPEHGPVETLTLELDPGVDPDRELQDLVRSIGSTVAHALDRGALLHAERAAAQAERDFSHALQTSLLSRPHVVDGVEIEVRYYAAVESSKVGGDWYDSFMVPDGSLLLVIGDIAGHDREAAIAMAQTRSMLRGIAFCSGSPPAAMVQRLDAAVTGLDIGTFSSAILARLHMNLDHHDGRRTMQWSNAGHPPPIYITGDGEVEILERPADPLLGVDPGRERGDHVVNLLPGSTLVLYTDGLIERRGEHLDVGIDRARRALRGAHALSLEEVFAALSAAAGPSPDDDVAILLLRVAPHGT